MCVLDRLTMVPQFQYPDHLFFFSTRNIESLLQLSGFHRVRQLRFSIVPELLLRQDRFKVQAPKTWTWGHSYTRDESRFLLAVDQSSDCHVCPLPSRRLSPHVGPSSDDHYGRQAQTVVGYTLAGCTLLQLLTEAPLILVADHLPPGGIRQ